MASFDAQHEPYDEGTSTNSGGNGCEEHSKMCSKSSDSDSESSCFDSDSDTSEEIEKVSIYSNPTEIWSRSFIYGQAKVHTEKTYGKWLVFRSKLQLDDTWHFIRRHVQSGALSSCTTGAKCSCMFYDPSLTGPGPDTKGVIIVYTTEADVDKAGFILVRLVEHDIKYKTQRATKQAEYAWKCNLTACRTLYWNNGEPSFECLVHTRGPDLKVEDKWNLNRVVAQKSLMADTVLYGCWEIVHDGKFSLTMLWQLLKQRIESGKFGPVEMICPSKRDRRDPTEMVRFILYTARENVARVGTKLAKYISTDIYYYRESPRRAYDHQILWRGAERVYEMTLRRPYRP